MYLNQLEISSFAYSVPGYFGTSKKGGSFVVDINYIGRKKDDWLLYYDGFYNPEIPPISYYSKDLIKMYDPFVSLRLEATIGLQIKFLFC